MAYSIYDQSIGTSFQPLSFEQLLQPVQIAQQQHNLIDEQLFNLSSESDRVGAYASESSDPISYQIYKNYSDRLKDAANRLADEGVNSSSMRDLLNLRTAYSSSILPIQEAITARSESQKRYNDSLSKDSSLITDINPGSVSLDAYIQDKNAYQYRSISGNDIRKSVSETAKSLSEKLYSSPEWRLTKDGQYFETIIQKGFDPVDIFNALSDNGNPLLKSLVNDALISSGISQWNLENNPTAMSRFLGYVNQGLYSAIGKTDVVTNRNIDYLSPLDKTRLKKLQGELVESQQGIPIREYTDIVVDNKVRERADRLERVLGNLPVNPDGTYDLSQEAISDPQIYHTQFNSSAGAYPFQYQEPESEQLMQEINYLNDKYGDRDDLGATQVERLNAGLRMERAMGATNLQRFSFDLTQDSPVNKLVYKGLLAGGQSIQKVNDDYSQGKKLNDKTKQEVLEDIKKGDVEYWANVRAGNAVIIETPSGDRYSIHPEVFGANVANQYQHFINVAERAVAIGNFELHDAAMREAMALIAVTSNIKQPTQSSSSNKFYSTKAAASPYGGYEDEE